MSDIVFLLLPIAAAIHIFEEYIFPGNFPKEFKKLLPRSAHIFTTGFHIIVNLVFFLLCLASAFMRKTNLVFSLSVFSLIFSNAILHIRGAIVTKRYYPGVISGSILYIPLATYTFLFFLSSKQMTWIQAITSLLLGVIYMGILMAFVLLQQRKSINHTGQV